MEEVLKSRVVFIIGSLSRLTDEEDDFKFAERFTALKTALEKQTTKETEWNKRIGENLTKIVL